MSVRSGPAQVKLAIERKGQLPLLTTFDQSRPLDEIIREICTNWSIKTPEEYAFQYSDYNCYITEENRNGIKNGAVLKLTLSPAKLAQDVVERLESTVHEERRNALATLSSISEDPTFASEFIKRNGLGLLINMVEGKPESDESLAHCLTSFQELMDHGEVSWDFLTKGFIKNLTVFVNKKNPPVDPTVLKRCLSILEAVCTNSPTFYPLVEKEVVFEHLILHLQNSNQDIQLNAIALLNSLFMRTTNKRQFVDTLSKKGVRTYIMNDIIRGGKSMRSEMEHQLYVYQSLIFRSLLVDMSLIKGNAQNQSLFESLNTLRQVVFESDIVAASSGRPLSQAGELSKDFKRLGFVDIDTPANDFSEAPPGLLPLHTMVYFARKHEEQYVKVILENHARGDDYECPFARTSIALTKMLCDVLEINAEPPSDSGKEYYPIFFTMDFAFEEFFCICIQLLNKTWKEMRATSGDFNRVMQVVKDQICRALKERHLSMELFRTNVFNVGYSQIVKILQDEIQARNIMELKAKPVVELREQVLPELKELVKQQRLDQLIQGALFDKNPGRGRGRDRYWYCRLSPNLKFLHYGDCQEGQTPSLENLPNKFSIAKVKNLLVGKDCPHSKDRKIGKTFVPFCFSLMYESEAEEKHLDFIAATQIIFANWTDGLATLLNKEMPSKESHEELETLLNMEMKLRLLDLENITIPETPPPIPADPPNFNFVYDFS
ncbi:engulfment and cell motility protein 1-like [Pocillopora verrucosa]|uniref:engulfment and cell motility protein 1-like n=1 Tax=Pocillopora verrucosa TaxID=203993 RepID=UPI00333EEAB2